MFKHRIRYRSRRNQKGLTLVLITMVLVVFLVFAAFAVDVNHALLSKTRLQNGVDAAALASAVKVSAGETDAVAQSIAIQTLTTMYAASGNTEIDIPAESISVQFSNDPQDFGSTYDDSLDTYIRVSVSDVPLNSYFLGYFGFDKAGAASAVAGPSSTIIYACNVVPMAVCAAPISGANDFLGYTFQTVYELKVADKNATEMGPGNFQLLDFGSGGSSVREYLAGGFVGCVDITSSVTTKPGASIGPVGQGLNTRFGDYSGGGMTSSTYPPDIYIKEPTTLAETDANGDVVYDNSWMHADYETESASCSGSASGSCTSGENGRRILPVPMVDCDGASGGTTELPLLAVGCFFLLQKAPNNNGAKDGVYGEFIEDCTITNGTTGVTPSSEGIFKIQLYRDPLSGES
ncbi:TadE/TadG family type IV pilus assembly protein [Vibrio barjaei]|uniref:TadE/TadG family type IV pilus assembly protein n=1 Tax=Vibrio barjaei TaxID=1676683 RepID=UPI0022848B73|nr:TadE/TadG family type IV pilus assembly protein [Vibrio barjaei]MCY9873310.1 pilus assembly protein [Vibrio barjaei]